MVALSLSHSVVAQYDAFTFVDQQQQSRIIPYAPVQLDGVEYVSLPEVVLALGGAHTVMPRRMRVDLAGTTAWVSLNDNRVNALSYFSLTHKVISNESGIFIARVDCPVFFTKAFRITLTPTDSNNLSPESNFSAFPGQTTLEEITSKGLSTIVLDPGHGGYEEGIRGITGLTEKDVVLSIAQRVKAQLLRDTSLEVVLTREKDVNLSDQQRAGIFREHRGDLLITLHAGGSYSKAMNGVALFYPAPPVRKINSLTTVAPLRSYTKTSHDTALRLSESIGRETSASDRGVHAIPTVLFQAVHAPACLIEVGCLTNTDDEISLSDEAYQEKIATGISQGIMALLAEEAVAAVPETLNNESIAQEIEPPVESVSTLDPL